MSNKHRTDRLTAQRVEVGLVFQQMLSTSEAAEYMKNNRVPAQVISRVLADASNRREVGVVEVQDPDAALSASPIGLAEPSPAESYGTCLEEECVGPAATCLA